MIISTLVQVFNLKPSAIITTTTIRDACRALTQRFNDHFQSTAYSFEPEAITEGGILFANWPDRVDGYKSIIIRFGGHKWPRITPEFGNVSLELFTPPENTKLRAMMNYKRELKMKDSISTVLKYALSCRLR